MSVKLASFSLVLVGLFCSASSGPTARPHFEQEKTATISGGVISTTRMTDQEYEIIASLKGCKCKDCRNEEKCDCCVPQSVQTHDHGHFDLSVRAGTYIIEVKGNTKSRVEITVEEGERKTVLLNDD